MKRWPSLLIVTGNSQPWCYSDYMWSMMSNVAAYPGPVGVYRMAHPKPDIRNNRGVKAFLRTDAEIMVRMDLDQSYPADFLTTMAPLVEEYKLIGPEIYDRWPSNDHALLCFTDKADPWGSMVDTEKATGIKSYPYTHTNNFYAREVVQAIPLPWWDNPMTHDGCDQTNHPDYDLLDKFREAGYPAYINHDVEVEHLFIGRATNDLHRRWLRGKE